MKSNSLTKILFKFFLFKRIDRESKIAFQTLIKDNAFELGASSAKDRWIGVRELSRILRRIFLESHEKFDSGSIDSLILENQGDASGQLRKWLYCQFNIESSFILSFRTSIKYLSRWRRTKLLLALLITSPYIIANTIVSARRANYALLYRYFSWLYAVRLVVSDLGVRRIFDFSPYVNSSNLMYLSVKELGVEVVKIPSIVPLTAHLSQMLADVLVISSAYHRDECEHFSQTMLVQEIQNRIPKQSAYLTKYMTQVHKVKKQKVGFYSHASWLRAKADHGETTFGLPDQESKLLEHLITICESKPEIVELMIFTHPRERQLEIRESVEAYYRSYISSSLHISFYYGFEPSSYIFEMAEIGVGTMSSVLFERLLCGYKTLFYTEGMSAFPLSNTTIHSICASDLISLETKISINLGIDERTYFNQNNIQDYFYDSKFYNLEIIRE